MKPPDLTLAQEIATTLNDGRTVSGTLWMHPSRTGSFFVEYEETYKTDGRADYKSESHMRMIARVILKELAEK